MQTAASHDTTRLPRQVRDRIKAIDAHLAESKASPADAPPPPPADGADPGITDPGAQPAAAASPAADPRELDPAYWRGRFDVVQGMLRKQREEANDRATQLNQRITDLEQENRTLKASGAHGTPAKVDLSAFFTPEQIEQFGEDQCEAIANATLKGARATVQQEIEAQVKPLRDRADADAKAAKQAKEDAFWDKLAELVPDYEAVDATDEWREWLSQKDENTGLVRQRILNQHHAALDAVQCAKVFQAYAKSKARPAPPVAPSGGAGSGGGEDPPANTPAQGYPSQAEMKDYYKRAKLGKVKEAERVAFEARLRQQRA